jgi:hypothetical protein
MGSDQCIYVPAWPLRGVGDDRWGRIMGMLFMCVCVCVCVCMSMCACETGGWETYCAPPRLPQMAPGWPGWDWFPTPPSEVEWPRGGSRYDPFLFMSCWRRLGRIKEASHSPKRTTDNRRPPSEGDPRSLSLSGPFREGALHYIVTSMCVPHPAVM